MEYSTHPNLQVDCSNPFLCPPKITAAGRRPRVKSNVRVNINIYGILHLYLCITHYALCTHFVHTHQLCTFCAHTQIVHILCRHTLCNCRQRNATSGTELDPLDPLVAGIAIYHHANDNDGHRRYSSFAEVVIIQICHYYTKHV